MLSDTELMDRVVNQMVDIAVHHSMDGWLINIENEIEVGRAVELELTTYYYLPFMHSASLVICSYVVV